MINNPKNLRVILFKAIMDYSLNETGIYGKVFIWRKNNDRQIF